MAAGQVDVSFVCSDGQDRREPLDQCWMQPFEAARPIHATRSKRGSKGFAGLWWFATTADHVGYESWLQRDHVMAWDFDPTVLSLAPRPLRLIWQRDGKTVTHTPDFFGSLSHLIRAAAIRAILDGTETISRAAMDAVRIDHAAESSARRAGSRQ
ncbi:hypothetical protein [Micromonospora sp. NPDC000668]|uniref:hypothetical protein n=1 Tax=Micromonospora sp. NPDC000668 TaxID=3364219 RepID=UPI0036C58D11